MVAEVVASIFLPSFNKGEYVLEAIESVMSQSFSFWELNILENSNDHHKTRRLIRESGYLHDIRIIYDEINFTDEMRKKTYIPAWLMNKYYLQATGEFIFYLSDDDLLDPNCLAWCMDHFQKHPDHNAAYFGMTRVGVQKPRPRADEVTKCSLSPVPRTVLRAGDMLANIDGGQLVHRKSVLDDMRQPFFPEDMKSANMCDGIFGEKLAQKHPVHPIPYYLLQHRYTPLSTWARSLCR